MALNIFNFSSRIKSALNPTGGSIAILQQLEHVVLHDISYHSGFFIKCAPMFYPYLFGNCNLDIVHIMPVPYFNKNRIDKTQKNDILDRVFCKIMIYAVYCSSLKASVSILLNSTAD